jgi:fucose permease
MSFFRLKKPHSSWIGIILSFYAFIAIGIAEGGLGVLLPSILTTYNLTPATVTLLFLSQVGGYIIAALASSMISGRIGLGRTLLLAAISLTSALIVYALTTHWLIMVAFGIFLGLGIGLIDAGINTFVASDRRNANLMGFLHGFYGIGALLGPAIATTLLAFGISWRLIYLIFAGLVGILIVGLFWVISKRYKPMTKRSESTSQTTAGANLHCAIKTPAVLVSGLLLSVYVGTEASIGNWAYTVQNMSRGTPELIAGYSIAGYWTGLTLGRFSLGQLVKYLGSVRTMNFSLILLLAGLLIWWLLPNQLWSLPLIGFALAAIFPTTVWLMPYRISDGLVPAAIGFLTSVASVGAVVIPTLLGWIADRASLAIIPALMIPLAVLMLVLQYWLVNNAPVRKV